MSDNQLPENRGTTLNTLLEEQRALNMRMLLAVQLRDMETQAELRTALNEVAEKIDQMLSGTLRR